MKILLCAFDAFGGESINPALEAIKAVKVDGIELVKAEIPMIMVFASKSPSKISFALGVSKKLISQKWS